jgi:hypothetical protein
MYTHVSKSKTDKIKLKKEATRNDQFVGGNEIFGYKKYNLKFETL